jgi:Phage integrase, N-terminal SAM-like domain
LRVLKFRAVAPIAAGAALAMGGLLCGGGQALVGRIAGTVLGGVLTPGLRAVGAVFRLSPRRSRSPGTCSYWLEHIAEPTIRRTTYATYEGDVRLHILPGIGKRKLKALQASDIRAWLSELDHRYLRRGDRGGSA